MKRVAVQGVLRIKDRKAAAAWFAEDGFVEGRDITLEYSDLEDLDAAETERRARAIVASRPDAILIPGDLVAGSFSGNCDRKRGASGFCTPNRMSRSRGCR